MCSVLLRRNTRNQIRKGRKLQFKSALRLRARFCLTSHANTFCKPLPKYTHRIAPNIRFKSRQLPILTEPRSHYTDFFPFRQCLFYTKTRLTGKFSPMLHSEEWNVLPFGHFHENKLLKTLG